MTVKEFVKRSDNLYKKFVEDLLLESKKLVLSRFDKQQDVDGNSKYNNAPLKDSTIRERGADSPILNRTGELKNSIEFTMSKGVIEIKSNLDYAEDLHQGNHSGKWGKARFSTKGRMKPRRFLDFPKEVLDFNSKIRKKLRDKLGDDLQALMIQADKEGWE